MTRQSYQRHLVAAIWTCKCPRAPRTGSAALIPDLRLVAVFACQRRLHQCRSHLDNEPVSPSSSQSLQEAAERKEERSREAVLISQLLVCTILLLLFDTSALLGRVVRVFRRHSLAAEVCPVIPHRLSIDTQQLAVPAQSTRQCQSLSCAPWTGKQNSSVRAAFGVGTWQSYTACPRPIFSRVADA